jgi:FlaA1/EpsC-like NDP-sugar epimerase
LENAVLVEYLQMFCDIRLTTAIPHVLVLVEGVPLLATRAMMRMNTRARRKHIPMSSRSLLLGVGWMGNFILSCVCEQWSELLIKGMRYHDIDGYLSI